MKNNVNKFKVIIIEYPGGLFYINSWIMGVAT